MMMRSRRSKATAAEEPVAAESAEVTQLAEVVEPVAAGIPVEQPPGDGDTEEHPPAA